MKLALRSKTIVQRRSKRLPASFVLPVLGGLLLVLIGVAVSFGSTAIPLPIVAQVLLNATGIFHFVHSWDSTTDVIIWQIRMPLVIGAVIVGAALSVAVTFFQG